MLSKCREFGVGDVQLEPPRQGDGAQTMSDRGNNPCSSRLLDEEAVVEDRVVRNQRPTFEQFA